MNRGASFCVCRLRHALAKSILTISPPPPSLVQDIFRELFQFPEEILSLHLKSFFNRVFFRFKSCLRGNVSRR